MVQVAERVDRVEIAEREVEVRRLTLGELGAHLGIPIAVRPWWGSVRQRGFTRNNGVMAHAQWECPGGYAYGSIKRPEVQKDVVVLWEGQCRYGRHKHRQNIEVLDIGERSLLVAVRQGVNGQTCRHFLIGMDDGHPFVAPLLRRVTTVPAAFDWLVPNPVRNAQAQGLDVKRQGDWFFIPCQGRGRWRQRDRRARAFRVRPWRGRWFPKTDVVYHHAPLFAGWGPPTRHIGRRVIYRYGSPSPVLVRGLVTAPDHPPVQLKTWHRGVRTRSTPGGNRTAGPGLRDD